MANETVERHLKEELHLRDDILAPRWCPHCRVMVMDPVEAFRYCPHCKDVMVDVEATVKDGKVVFRRSH